MKQTINFNQFVDAFNNAGRQDQFSYEALRAIFGYIEDYEQDSGEEIELDVIAICCDWSEESPKDIAESYDVDLSNADESDDESVKWIVQDYLDGYTQCIALDNGNIVYVNF
jgi:hypothetical protein